MRFTFDSTCQTCGKEVQFTVPAACNQADIVRLAKCPYCGGQADYIQAQRIFVVIDVLTSLADRPISFKIDRISISGPQPHHHAGQAPHKGLR